jgi:hypothetical protein
VEDCRETMIVRIVEGSDSIICNAQSMADYVIHTHNEYCYSNGELICTLPELYAHTHGADCYTEETQLVCGMEESQGHSHSEECYDEEQNLICTLEESQGHSHSEECYATTQTLTCDRAELTEHSHDQSCYTEGVLTCGLPEVLNHQHTESCVAKGEDREEPMDYSCGKEEHVHTEQCYEEPDALEFDFTIEDSGITGTVTLPWDESLPDDLQCTVIVLDSNDEDYDQLYQAAVDALKPEDEPAEDTQTAEDEDSAEDDGLDSANDISLFRLEWTSGGEEYTLPEGLTPTLVLNVPAEDDLGDVEQITGIVITPKEDAMAEEDTEEAEEEDTEEAEEEEATVDEAEAMDVLSDVPSAATLDDEDAEDEAVVLSVSSGTQSTKAMAMAAAVTAEDTSNDTAATSASTASEYSAAATTGDNVGYSTTTSTADSDGTIKLTVTGSTSTMAVAKSIAITVNAMYFERVDDLSQIEDGDMCMIVFAENNALLNKNTFTFGKNTKNEAAFDTPKKTTITEISDGSNNYFVFAINKNVFVRDVDTYYPCFWYFEKHTEPGTLKSGTGVVNMEKINGTISDGVEYGSLSDNPEYYSKFTDGYYYTLTNYKDDSPLWLGKDRYVDDGINDIYQYSTAIQFVQLKDVKNVWRIRAKATMDWSTDGTYVAAYTLGYDRSANSVYQHSMYGYSDNSKSDYYDGEHLKESVLIFKYVGTTNNFTQYDDEAAAEALDKTEYVEDSNPIYSNSTLLNEDVSSLSEAKTGTDSENLEALDGSVVTYASDTATSAIKDNLSLASKYSADGTDNTAVAWAVAQEENDGRIVTDKTVIYGDDDYDAYDDYEQGEFSVTLSALGQEWVTQEEFDYTTPVDMVFILDLSSSMKATHDSYEYEEQWRSSAIAFNEVAKELMDRNPQNRMSLVVFSNVAQVVLPMDHYTYSEEEADKGTPFLSCNPITYSELINTQNEFHEKYYDEYYEKYYDEMLEQSKVEGAQNSWTEEEILNEAVYKIEDKIKNAVDEYLYEKTGGQYSSPANLVKRAGYYNYDRENTLKVSAGVTNSSGETISCDLTYNEKSSLDSTTTNVGAGLWSITYTQLGLQEAYKQFASVDDVEVTVPVCDSSGNQAYDSDGNEMTKTVTRQPVYVLLSDGGATLGTNDYINPESGATYGVGSVSSNYLFYSILSANYFKNMTSIHYDIQSYFYTIALGIGDSTTTEKAELAMLDPSKEKVDVLETAYPTLYRLLNGYSASYATVNTGAKNNNYEGSSSSYGSAKKLNGLGKTQYSLTAIYNYSNPYTDYDYADEAYYGTYDADELGKIFDNIINEVQPVNSYYFPLADGTDLKITEQVGLGMEVKDTPVLRYNGVNIEPSYTKDGTDSDGRPYTLYSWTGNVSREENTVGKSTSISLDGVTAKVSHTYQSEDGKVSYDHETIVFSVTEEALPVFFPNIYKQFYYQAQPIRLIYKVGLSEDELESFSENVKLQNVTYYTSYYDPEATEEENMSSTTVTFTPAVTSYNTGAKLKTASAKSCVNPYYSTVSQGLVNTTVTKTVNTTNTSKHVFTESVADSGTVTQNLGNNGTLTINREASGKVTVNKVWEPEGTQTCDVTFRLYASGKVQKAGASDSVSGVWCLGEKTIKAGDNDWTAVFTNLPDYETVGDYTYTYENFYIRELPTDEEGSYTTSYQQTDGTAIDTVTLTLTAKDKVDSAFLELYPMLDDEETVDVAIANGGAVTVVNSSTYNLPYTGGEGAKPYYIAGVMLIMFSGAVLSARKLRRHY